MTYHVSARVRTEYFEQFVAGTKKREVRRADDSDTGRRWRGIAAKAALELSRGRPVEAVWLCGKRTYRAPVLGVALYSSADLALGRPPSEQGRADVGDGEVVGFDVGPGRLDP